MIFMHDSKHQTFFWSVIPLDSRYSTVLVYGMELLLQQMRYVEFLTKLID